MADNIQLNLGSGGDILAAEDLGSSVKLQKAILAGITSPTSGGNSTTTPLGSGATFTGTWEQNDYADVMVSVKADNSGTLYFDFSPDGTNADSTFPPNGFVVADGINEFHTAVKGPRYFRCRLVNDSGAQSYLRLYTYYGSFRQGNAPTNASIGTDADAQTVRLGSDFLTDVAKGLISGHSLIRKFGRNSDVDIGAAETIWANGGAYTFPTAAQTVDVVSSSANDTNSAGTGARTVELQGLDGSYLEVSETVNMNGTTAVTSSNTYLRLNRAIVRTAGSGGQNAGTITIDQTTSGTVMAGIAAGLNQTQLGVYTVPAAKTAYLLGVTVGAMKGTSSGCDVDMFIRPENEVFQLKGSYGCHTQTGSTVTDMKAPLVIAAKSDVRFDATVTANNTQVSVEFPMLLVDD